MSDAKDAADANEAQSSPEPGIGAVPTWDWRAGTDLGAPSSTSWAPQPIETASSEAWPTTTWAVPPTSWATPAPPTSQPEPADAHAAPQRPPIEEPAASAPEMPPPVAASAPAPLADGSQPVDAPAGTSTPSAPVPAEQRSPAAPSAMPRTIRHARRALWLAMGLAAAGVAITTVPQLVAAASLDVAPSSSWLRHLGGGVLYAGIAAATAASAKRRRSAAIAAAGLLVVVSCTGMAVLTLAPLPAAIAALILLLLPSSRAWLTIHPDRIRRLLGD